MHSLHQAVAQARAAELRRLAERDPQVAVGADLCTASPGHGGGSELQRGRKTMRTPLVVEITRPREPVTGDTFIESATAHTQSSNAAAHLHEPALAAPDRPELAPAPGR